MWSARLPPILTPGYWSAKRLALLVGFLLSIVGSVGTQLVVTPYENASSALELRAKDLSAKIDTVKNAQAQYILFQQQGALIFAMSAAGLASGTANNSHIISQLFQLNMLDRTEAVQTIIGSLALDRRLDYRSTFDHYKSLVDAARMDISLPTYTAVDDQEKVLSRQATEEIGRFQDWLTQVQQLKSQADASAGRSKLVLLVAMSLGATFLLAANLISTREPKAEPARPTLPGPSVTSSSGGPADLTSAAYLIEVALDQARALGKPQHPVQGEPSAPG
ncbi:MAG: hypothetical protein AB1440_19655 [Pseudomonadota bacterium]